MDWTCLGHATWLCEAAGLRLLFDPILGASHHGGIFEVSPRRTLVAEALRPDFILVSHRHPDHFDVPSLRALIALDRDAVIVTPDPLVAWACETLGARTVQLVPANQRVDLDGLAFITTPSLAPDEWGAVVATRDGAVWNQVDTVLTDPAEVARVATRAAAELGADALALALVRWQPLLEVAAQLAQRAAFPHDEYADLLAAAVATGARAVVPSAAGEAYTAPWTAMNRRVYPVPESRFLRDLTALAPGIRALPCQLGGIYRVRANTVECTQSTGLHIPLAETADPRQFDPLELPPVRDPGLPDIPESTQRAEVEAWIRGDLAAGLARTGQTATLVLELRFVTAVDIYTLHLDRGAVATSRAHAPDWDLYNVAAGSLVWEVLTARRHWGDVLLAGALRGCSRAYTLAGGRLQRLPLADLFVYHGLAYDDSVARAVRREVEAS